MADSLRERLVKLAKSKGMSMRSFEESCNLGRGNISNMTNESSLGSDKLSKIIDKYPEVSLEWLVIGTGDMLRSDNSERRLIPLFNDVASIGGDLDRRADVDQHAGSVEWIDAGDWFPEATAAIRHYGDSMVEYPSGCILVLKRVQDRRLLLNGRNYVIETTEFRVTKQLQYDGGDTIMAYSSNRETYPDGRQIHSPLRIPVETVRSLDLVLGCVQKEYSNGAIPIIKK